MVIDAAGLMVARAPMLLPLWAGVLLATTAAESTVLFEPPAFMGRRAQQQMAPECAEVLAQEPGKSVEDVAACVATCMKEVDDAVARGGENAEKTVWTASDPLFTQENEHGVGDRSHCAECVGLLQFCAGESREQQRAQAAQEGRTGEGGWMRLDITAEDFRCQATVKWGDEASVMGEPPEKRLRFSMRNVCFPAVCSYDDIQDLFQYDIKSTDRVTVDGRLRTNYEGDATCDIAATFVDDSAPWWILVFGFFFVVANVALSSSGSPGFLRCMLWCYMAFDLAVGLGLIVYGFMVLNFGNMPGFVKISFPLFGAVQVIIGSLLSIVMDSGDSRGIKTGVCACLAGKTWLLYFSNALALVHGIVCLVVGVVYKVTGKASIESWMHDLDDTQGGMR